MGSPGPLKEVLMSPASPWRSQRQVNRECMNKCSGWSERTTWGRSEPSAWTTPAKCECQAGSREYAPSMKDARWLCCM